MDSGWVMLRSSRALGGSVEVVVPVADNMARKGARRLTDRRIEGRAPLAEESAEEREKLRRWCWAEGGEVNGFVVDGPDEMAEECGVKGVA
jgi:hypothetical protein